MSNESIEDVLRGLSENEATVLYWKYWGLDYKEIGEKLGYSVDWVTLEMGKVYRKLGFDKNMHWTKRRDILKKDVYPVLLKLLENDPKNLENFPLTITVPTEEIREEPPPPEPEPQPDPEMTALVLLDQKMEAEEGEEIKHGVPPPIIIPPQLPGPRRPIIPIILISIGVCLALLYAAYRVGQVNAPTPAPIANTVTQEVPTETPTGLSTETLTVVPTDTLVPTVTETLTPVPTETKSPLGLKVRDELSDERVTLRLKEIRYDQGISRVGSGIAPLVFRFDFTNHSGATLQLQVDGSKFRMEDNTGNVVECTFWDVSGTVASLQKNVEDGRTVEIGVFCGEGFMLPEVEKVTLYVTDFSSLPESTWEHEIVR